MDTKKISDEIAKLKRASKEASTSILKNKLNAKIEALKKIITDSGITTRQLAVMLLGSKSKIESLSASEWKETMKRLSARGEYSFLKGMSKGEVKDDLKREAKPVGWRFKGRGKYRKPTKSEIIAGRKRGTVYYENRPERSDVVHAAKLKTGGNLKPIPSGNKGLPKLPEEVRNKMGYMAKGGGVGDDAKDRFIVRPTQTQSKKRWVGNVAIYDNFLKKEVSWVRPSETKQEIERLKKKAQYIESLDDEDIKKSKDFFDKNNDKIWYFHIDTENNKTGEYVSSYKGFLLAEHKIDAKRKADKILSELPKQGVTNVLFNLYKYTKSSGVTEKTFIEISAQKGALEKFKRQGLLPNNLKFAKGGGVGKKITIKDIDWANDDNKKLGVWLLTSVDGNKILQNSKNGAELEKNVMAYYEKKGSVARMKWDEEEDEGLSWVTFDDLFNEINSVGKTQMAQGGGVGEVVKENKEMVMNSNFQIMHHTKELEQALKSVKVVPAWVVAKIYDAAEILSDVTHYLDGESKMKTGGKLIGNQHKLDLNKNGRLDAEDFKMLRGK